MNGHENLIPVRTKEEARDRGRSGGIKSGEARRRKRDSKQQMLDLLSCVMEVDGQTLDDLLRLGIKGKGPEKNRYTLESISKAALVQKAMRGDVGAHRLIEEMIDEDIGTKRMRAQHEHELKMAEILQQETETEDDGFLDALNAQATGVFVDGVDEPENAADSLSE